MAKIVTENFRVETTNELYKSFFNRNDSVVANFQSELGSYSVDNSLGLTENNVSQISALIANDLESLVPDNNYYIFASSVEKAPEIQNTQRDKRDFQRRIVFGNKITENDIYHMFDRYPWSQNVIYDSFDDSVDITNLNMYVNVLDGDLNEAPYKVFKCIRNNNGAVSTVKPSTSNLNPNFETTLSDGYVWKYMFEVTPSDYITYSTTQSLPYTPNQTIIDAAVESVSDIRIDRTRVGLFSAYNLGSTTVKSVTVEDATNNTYKIELDVQNEPQSSDGSYVNMYLRLSISGELFDIINSAIPLNPSIEISDNRILNVFVQSDQNLLNVIASGASTKVVPKIKVSKSSGDDCVAYGSLDSEGTLNDIFFKNKGTQYKYATAVISLPDAIQEYADENSLRVILSPRGGHGSDPISELRMSKLIVVTNFVSNELTNIPSVNSYTQVGLIKNPLFADGTFPKDLDNRMVIIASGDIRSSVIAADSFVYQDKIDETVSGKIHHIEYDASANQTTIYLVDYVGDFEGEFASGPAYAKTNQDDLTSDSFTINTVTKGNYVPYTGDLLHFVDFDAITRNPARKEKVKFVFDF